MKKYYYTLLFAFIGLLAIALYIAIIFNQKSYIIHVNASSVMEINEAKIRLLSSTLNDNYFIYQHKIHDHTFSLVPKNLKYCLTLDNQDMSPVITEMGGRIDNLRHLWNVKKQDFRTYIYLKIGEYDIINK
jgi:hypothetical protein